MMKTTDEFQAQLAELRSKYPPRTHLFSAGDRVLCVHCARSISVLATLVALDPTPSDGLMATGGPDHYLQILDQQEDYVWRQTCASYGWEVCDCPETAAAE